MAPILDYITGLVSPKKIAKDSNQTSTTILQSEVELQNQPHHFSNEDITHPDPKEKSVSASSYEINGSIAEIAGFTQEKLLEMCSASKITYDDKKLSQACYISRKEFYKQGYHIIPFHYRNEREAGLIFERGKEITIAYHGTQDYNDIITDINSSFTTPAFLSGSGRIHRGFYNAFESSLDNLKSILEYHTKRHKLEIKDLKINLTGHSMGGAIAKIAALYLNKTQDAQDLHIATFGDPRVFDFTASEAYNEALGDKTIRVTQQDPVAALVPGFIGYVHVGAQLQLKKSQNYHVHTIDGYHEAIQEIKECDFQSNNNISLFYDPVKRLNALNCKTFDKTQHTIVNRIRNLFLTENEQCEEAVSIEEAVSLLEQPNTEISFSRVNQVAKESRVL